MARTLVKVCGCNSAEAVDAAVDAGADYIGLVHFEPSPRHVTLEQGAALRARVPARTKVVLLIVNMEPFPTARAVDAVRPDIVQFHGRESAEWLGLLKRTVPHELWKAIGVRSEKTLIDTLAPPLESGGAYRSGYNDGILDARDNYAKVKGSVQVGVTQAAWDTWAKDATSSGGTPR